MGLCQIAVVPIVTWLVIGEGWRQTCLIWAVVMSVGIPVTLLFVRSKRPEYYGLLPDGYTAKSAASTDEGEMLQAGAQYAESFEEQEYTVRQAMRTRTFWMMLLAMSFSILIMSGFTIHVIPFLTDMDISQTTAGAMLSMMVFCTIPSRFVSGILIDRVPKNRMQYIAAGAVFTQALGFLVFLALPGIAMSYVMLILYGLGHGAVTPTRLSMGGRYFGRKAFASIAGIGMFINAPLGFLAPIFTGWVHDVTNSYNAAFITFAALLLCSAVILFFLRPPGPPQQVTDIRKLF
jgi:cyanate permease